MRVHIGKYGRHSRGAPPGLDTARRKHRESAYCRRETSGLLAGASESHPPAKSNSPTPITQPRPPGSARTQHSVGRRSQIRDSTADDRRASIPGTWAKSPVGKGRVRSGAADQAPSLRGHTRSRRTSTHGADDLEAVGDVLQLTGDIFAEWHNCPPQSGQQSP
jgi:hypothetical protein